MRLPVAALAAAALALAVTPAHAASPTYRFGCGYDALAPEVVVAGHHAGDRTAYTGVVYLDTLLYDESSPATPVSGTVRCYLLRNGAEIYSTPATHGTTLVTAAAPLSFTAGIYDVVTMCEEVAFDGGPSEVDCAATTTAQIPPQPVWDAVDAVTGTVTPYVAGAACPVTGDSAANRELAGAWLGSDGYAYGFPC